MLTRNHLYLKTIHNPPAPLSLYFSLSPIRRAIYRQKWPKSYPRSGDYTQAWRRTHEKLVSPALLLSRERKKPAVPLTG